MTSDSLFVDKNWVIEGDLLKAVSGVDEIVRILLKNRGLRTKKQREEFLYPKHPSKLSLASLEISALQVDKSIKRIKKAVKNNEKIVIYGDYDADGVCATAILWEAIYSFYKNVVPYIPDRFSEGYGLSGDGVGMLKKENPGLSLIITVDNGIVAHDAVNCANGLGIDVIVTDHHQRNKKLPKAYSFIHTTKIGGAGIAWIFARELSGKLSSFKARKKNLDLCAIGTVSDQLPLIGPNRSFVKHGLEVINNTERPGLLALLNEAGVEKGSVGVYQLGFVVGPRINAMGRVKHAIDSLRLLCTNDKVKAEELARLLGKTNRERQTLVEEVALHAREQAEKVDWRGAIFLAHKSYHEGVIGLVAAKLVEEYYRPTVVLSKGKLYSKASARSILGFNVVEAIRELAYLTEDVGGHPMAAGFTIRTENIIEFSKKFEDLSSGLLTEDILKRNLRIDLEIGFSHIVKGLVDKLVKFSPTGFGNPKPTFVTKGVSVLNMRTVGAEGRHLKLKLERDGRVFDAIAFNFGDYYKKLLVRKYIDIAYSIQENYWRDRRNVELNIADIKFDTN